MTAYYNEIEPFAAEWLENLIREGHIADGIVDRRSIRDVRPADLAGFTQCHFFAGIGIWSHALRQAGWPDDRPVWTGSCPCQPFSQAGAGGGFDDERHLWPSWQWLIQQCRPRAIFGEQVESPDGRMWLDLVCSDLEALAYACGPVVFPSAGIGAPNIRHRIYWVADTNEHGRAPGGTDYTAPWDDMPRGGSTVGGLGDAEGRGRGKHRFLGEAGSERQNPGQPSQPDKDASRRLGNASQQGLPHPEPQDLRGAGRRIEGRATPEPSGPHHPWRELEWIDCTDGKRRPIEPEYVKMVARHSARVGRCSPSTEGQIKNGSKDHQCAAKELPPLRRNNESEALPGRRLGATNAVLQADLLRSTVHGERDGGHNKGGKREEQPPSVRENGEGPMPELRQDAEQRSSACPPSGPRSNEQRPAELEDVMRLLPSSLPLAEFYGDRRTACELRALRDAILQAGDVRHTSDQIQEIWRSLAHEDQNLIRLGFDTRDWIFVRPFPLAPRNPGDVGRLRAYGNAINAQLAAEVIAAYLTPNTGE